MKYTTLTVTKNIKVSANYNSVGLEATLTGSIEGQDPETASKEAYTALDKIIQQAFLDLPEDQKELIEAKKPNSLPF